jgi:tryptophan-rich sensory protein
VLQRVPAAPAPRSHSGTVASVVGGLVTLVAVVAGVVTTFTADLWYQQMRLPAFAPPEPVLVPACVAVYLCVAVAGWRLWDRSPRSAAATSWTVQLLATLAWTVVLFGLSMPEVALVPLGVALAAGLLAVARGRRSTRGAWVLVPNLLWLGYAIALTAALAALN